MKHGIKVKSYILPAVIGAFSSLFFISAFDVYTMMTFHKTSRHPEEYPAMLAVGIVSFVIVVMMLSLDISVISKSENKVRVVIAGLFIFIICMVLTVFMWSYIISLFDSDMY